VAKPSYTTNKCPICKKDTVPQWRPFCSKHCADVDLGNWLKGNYALPGEVTATEDDFNIPDQLPHGDRAR
jgi:endogenous inhibitor of DNA gyrase (YacG/DUF329 family)